MTRIIFNSISANGYLGMHKCRILAYVCIIALICAQAENSDAGTILRLVIDDEVKEISDSDYQFQVIPLKRVMESKSVIAVSRPVNSVWFHATSTSGSNEIWHLRLSAGSDFREGYYELEEGEYAFNTHGCLLSNPPICSASFDVRHNGAPVPVSRETGGLTGQFEILDAVFGEHGDVQRFAADFELFDHSGTTSLAGQIRHNSTIPIPEPSSVALTIAICFGLALIREHRVGVRVR